MAASLSRRAYADMFGPTTGDKVRLADTDLVIEVERDHTIYGEEVKFGGGKVIRDGMGQSQVARSEGAVDTVITNALILDHWGIVKADIGLKDGRIAVPEAPGLGIEIDMAQVDAAHRLYRDNNLGGRDDSVAMQYLIPGWTFDPKMPCLQRN